MAYTIPVSISAYYHTDKLQQYVPSSDFKVFVQYDNSTSAVKYDPVDRIALQPGYNLLVLSAFGQYSGIVSTDIEAYADVALADVEFNDSSFVYTGLPITPSFDVKIAGTQIRPSYAAKKILFPNSSSPLLTKQYPDYDAFSTSYINNLNVGEASVVLSSKAVETSKVKTFQINRRSMQDISVQIDGFETDIDYKGHAVVQSISVQIGGTTISSAYYTVSYSHNDALGQALCKVEGKTNLSDTVEKTFSIWGNLSDASIFVQEKIDYTGDNIYASPQIKLFDIPLNSSEHYSLQYNDSDYIKPGIKHGLVVGLESGYVHSTPTRSFQYQIVGNAASAIVFGPNNKYIYTGSDIKPPFDVILDDIWLDSGIDYSTSYPSEDYSSIGQKQIQINGIGNYISAQTIDYAIYDPNSTEQINTLVYKVDGSIQTVDTKHLTREALGIDGQADRKISKVIVGSQVETLENRLFSNCKMLTYVSLKNCSEDIELPDECFDGCFRLQTVVFPGQSADDSYTRKKYAYGNNGYIDTGYIPTSHTNIGIQLFLDEKYNNIPIAGFSSNGILKINNDYRLTVPSQNQIVFRIGGTEWTYSKSQMLNPGMTHHIIFQHDGSMRVDGTSITGSKKEYSYIDRVLSHSICVFGQSNAQTTNAIVERISIVECISIYEDRGVEMDLVPVIKMDLVPAVDALGIGCLVDTLTDKKYYSQNGYDIVCTDEYGKPEYYFVEFDPNGGTVAIDVKKVKSGDSIGTLPQAKKEGYMLSAWIDSIAQSEVSPTTVVDDDILCIAKWLALTKVTYEDPTFHSMTKAYYNVNGLLNTAKAPMAASNTADSLYAGDSITGLASIGSIGAFERSKLVHVYLTDKITSIPNNAFKACERLQSIQLGNYTSSIGDNSFFSTTQLSSIELPQSVSSIGTQAFYNSGLAELDISRLTSLVEVKRSTFGACSKLSSVKLPNSILSIEARAFSNCQALSSIDLPGLLQTIDNEAFSSNESLTSLSVHSFVESIGQNAFRNCTELQSVVVDDINSWNGIQFENYVANPLYYAHYLYDADNDGALVEKTYIRCDDVKLSSISPYLYSNCYSLKDVIVENGITQIGKEAFLECYSLSSVVLANSVSSIDVSAFSECSSLTSINVPSSLAELKSYAFSKSGINNLVLSSKSFHTISQYAFANSMLNSISVDGANLSIDRLAFYNCYDLTCAYFGEGIDSYQKTNISQGQEGLFTGCSSLIDVTLPFDSSSRYAITQINDKEGICYPFGKSQYEGSVSVQNKYYTYYVPASLRCMTVLDTRNHSAYKKLFENLSMLSCVHIGDSLSSIQQMAFYMCSGIQKIVVASSVTSIDEYAFALDDQDINVVLPNLTYVAFEGRSKSQVKAMENYPWHLAESSISCELD